MIDPAAYLPTDTTLAAIQVALDRAEADYAACTTRLDEHMACGTVQAATEMDSLRQDQHDLANILTGLMGRQELAERRARRAGG